MLKYILCVVLIIILSGCATQYNKETIQQNMEPKWLINPYLDNDDISAVGCAQIHFKGITAQKNLAISRAIDRIAIQNNVIVNNVIYRQKNNSNDNRNTSSSSTSSLHIVEEIKISTRTKAIYTKSDGEICAWVVQK
jgi:hypothetical protein